jgi:hypothetical protein
MRASGWGKSKRAKQVEAVFLIRFTVAAGGNHSNQIREPRAVGISSKDSEYAVLFSFWVAALILRTRVQ